MKLHELKPNNGATKNRRRVGRGIGSGMDKTSGRGEKGQKSRSGYSRRAGFEGGQTPLHIRVRQVGFNNNQFRTEYAIINVSDLDKFEEGTVVTPVLLHDMGLVKKQLAGIKVLGNGEITKKITVKAHKFSNMAVDKITAAGGSVEVI